ncbi:MAG: holo-ACP synthase [Nitrospirae bacterium]|nr:holo-ACP synthase [Nitrospirota bacterium]
MIYGIGIDLIKIRRMKEAVDKWGKKFLDKIFTEDEVAYCYEKKEPYLSLAVRFAAKEALIKAIGSEVFIPLTDIEIVNNNSGRPSIAAKGRLQEFFKTKAIKSCHLSLSHEKEFGIAHVVLEK